MSKKASVWLAAIAVVGLLLAGNWWLNRGYGETTEQGYQYALALYSACNQRDEAKLQEISRMVSRAEENGEVRSAEARWLASIIDRGLAGNWDRAASDVRRLMNDQLRDAES